MARQTLIDGLRSLGCEVQERDGRLRVGIPIRAREGTVITELAMEGQSDMATFRANLEAGLEKAMLKASADGISEIDVHINGKILLPKVERKPLLPTEEDIARALFAGKFRQLREGELDGFAGATEPYVWEAPDFMVVADIHGSTVSYEVLDTDGEPVLSTWEPVALVDMIGELT